MVHGHYFDAAASAAHEATLEAEGAQWTLRVGERLLSLDPVGLKVSDRIGSIPRRLTLPDGAEFETADNDGIDALLAARPDRGGPARFVHALERRWGLALGALVTVVLLSVAFVSVGLPALTGWAARHVPTSVDARIGTHALAILDRSMLQPSALDPARQQALQAMFANMVRNVDDAHEYRLELRASRLGPNALALPSGIIIVTDALVGLARHDEELQAVIAHEIGHVRGRHALRQLIQSAGVSMLAVVLLGDVSSMAALASAAPVLLQAEHSRDLEREADAFARVWLSEHGIASTRFDAILCRMVGARKDDDPAPFLSTHPPVGERAQCP